MKIASYVLGGILLIALGILVGAGYYKYSGPPSTELRWKNAQDVKAEPNGDYQILLARDPTHQWATPTVSVYSAPHSAPPAPTTPAKRNASDDTKAATADSGGADPEKAASGDAPPSVDADQRARTDPYRVNRVLIASVTKGLDTLPGERLLWTRVFVRPTNFQFAGYTVAATDNKSIKIASVESSSDTKLSIKTTTDTGIPAIGKPEIGEDIGNTQKSTADLSEQYENLGIDIQPDFLRIIRESAPGGDVVGNTAVDLSMLTEPDKIWCDSKGESCGYKPRIGPPQLAKDGKILDDQLVLLVSSAHLAEGEKDPGISVFPQNALPHCPLKADVWMLYEVRQIEKGRENYVEGMQEVKLIQGGYDAKSVEIVAADDIAPAVWSIKVTNTSDPSPATDTSPDLVGQTVHGTPRRLVFTDYLTTTEVAHWVKSQLATAPDKDPTISGISFQVDASRTLTPFKHTRNDCEPLAHPGAAK